MPRKQVRPPIYIGIYGTVLALDPSTGEERWRVKLKSAHFVSVVLVDDLLLASTGGELYSLDKKDGSILWHNKLKGLGHGLVTVAGASPAGALTDQQQQHQIQASAAAATMIATS